MNSDEVISRLSEKYKFDKQEAITFLESFYDAHPSQKKKKRTTKRRTRKILRKEISIAVSDSDEETK
tara:strand:- start:41 stop:241 length:201 start_codon:yes stop_codon:yes gene_type:complete